MSSQATAHQLCSSRLWLVAACDVLLWHFAPESGLLQPFCNILATQMWTSCVFLYVLVGRGQFSEAWSSPEGDWQRLAKRNGTDQGDLFGGTLPLFFEPRRQSVRNLRLASIQMRPLLLLDYFPNSSYVSIDHTRMADAFFSRNLPRRLKSRPTRAACDGTAVSHNSLVYCRERSQKISAWCS